MNNDAVRTVQKHTSYTEEEAVAKLALHGGDPMRVVREYMGLSPDVPTETERIGPAQRQQAMFRQFRTFLRRDPEVLDRVQQMQHSNK